MTRRVLLFVLALGLIVTGCRRAQEPAGGGAPAKPQAALGAAAESSSVITPLRPGQFIRVENGKFVLDGEPYRFAGANFWQGMNLGVDGPGGNRARLLRELDRLRGLGVTNLRVMASSEGPNTEPYRMVPALMVSPGVYDEKVLDGLDFLLAEMGKRGMRAVMVLNNFWQWSGGMAQYVSWREKGPIPYPGDYEKFINYSAKFYSFPECQKWFRDHIAMIVNRVNPYTGTAYKDDPAVFSWELGNEPRRYPAVWIGETAAYIKSLDRNHMVTTGSEGAPPGEPAQDFVATHKAPAIDYATIHIWPQNWDWYDPKNSSTYTSAEEKCVAYFRRLDRDAVKLRKPLVLEEFGLARDFEPLRDHLNPAAPTTLKDQFYGALYREVIASMNGGGAAAGDNFWAWAGEARPGAAWVGDPPHEPAGWYSVYDSDASTLAIISAHAKEMGGRAADRTPADLLSGFVSPPASARPWVYWFWLNGNITREGITADLEAMQRAGIGGALIMEVDQGAPVGPVDFMSQDWRDLFHFAVTEAERLGLEINMNDDAGWNGSGGPWITPEQSMQKVVWSETELSGPRSFSGTLPQPAAKAGFYRDITVLAFPASGPYRIADIKVKAAYEVGTPGPPARSDLPPAEVIDRARIVDLKARMDVSGRLSWDVPDGKWTVVRFGHTATGVENAPAPKTGRGLECDKLSRAGIEANYAGMMEKLIADAGPAAGRTLVRTHIDSWENGSQNWTALMGQEFGKRRGYDLMPFLPVLTGRVVGSLEVSERFLWDLRKTVSELVVENYARGLAELARARGVRLSIEAYGGPCDDLPYAGEADEPMCEFWMGGGAFETAKGMASAVHAYGKTILGAESFTAGDRERWLEHPASIKALGDRAFTDGVNRFVFHRYALQPWADRRPGMTMGPWGLHYERTNTWWELTPGWHDYLARCQFMLRMGKFAADICYLQPEVPPQSFNDHPRRGYDWDEVPAELVKERMTVEDGRVVLPGGMRYRVLVLPDPPVMTPGLLGKVLSLVKDGATVIGPRPERSPSLAGYPGCDTEVQRLADELWADCDGKTVKEHRLGKGRVVWGETAENVLAGSGVGPDFSGPAGWRYIHRVDGEADIYFVSNQAPYAVTAAAAFRVAGKAPELWHPETGRVEAAAAFRRVGGVTDVLLPLGPSGSVFVVFRERRADSPGVIKAARDGKEIWTAAPAPVERIVVEKAVYGIPGDPARTRDVRDKVQRLADSGETGFRVSQLAAGDDPAVNVVKTLVLEYTVGGRAIAVTRTDPETVELRESTPAEELVDVRRASGGRLKVEAWRPGAYEITMASGQTYRADIPSLPPAAEIGGPWQVRFPAGWGAPAEVTFDRLISWPDSGQPGVKYFSGTAAYRTTFTPAEGVLAGSKERRVYLDLGDVRVMARVVLNGRDVGVLWKPPYRVDVTDAVRPGPNALEVRVTNLWPNRMIGDEELAEDSLRNKDGTLKEWPAWLKEGKPSPTGRFTFTSWRLWKKGEPLLPSGLLGPVRLVATEVRDLGPAR